MSFLGTLGGIGKGILHGLAVANNVAGTVANVAAPFEPLIAAIPGFGGPAAALIDLMVHVEKWAPNGKGAAKKGVVMAAMGLLYPDLSAEQLGPEIDSLVGILNRLAAAGAKA